MTVIKDHEILGIISRSTSVWYCSSQVGLSPLPGDMLNVKCSVDRGRRSSETQGQDEDMVVQTQVLILKRFRKITDHC
jgi:hypothetical protein